MSRRRSLLCTLYVPNQVYWYEGEGATSTTYQTSFHGQSQLPPLRQTDDALDHMTYPTAFKLPDASFELQSG
jgi:hypothetical protein